MSNGLDLISLGLILLLVLAVASLAGALLFLYRWLIRRRLFPQLPRIWGVDRKRFTLLAVVFALLSLAWLGLAFLAQPTPEAAAPPAPPAAGPGPDPSPTSAPAVQPGEPGYFPLPHRSVQTSGEERALPPGPDRDLPHPGSDQPGPSDLPGQADPNGLPGGVGDALVGTTVTSLTTSSSTTSSIPPATVKEPDATPVGPPPVAAPPAPQGPPTTASPAPPATVPTGAPAPVAPAATTAPPAAGQAPVPTTTAPPAPAAPPVKPPPPSPAPLAKTAPPRAERSAAPVPSAGPARYAACLGSHKTQAQALVQKTRLVRAGVMAEVWAVDLPGKGRWHRVCAGDFATLAEAQAQAKAWEKQGLATTPFPVRRP